MTVPRELLRDAPDSDLSSAPEVWRRALPWLAGYAALQVLLRMIHLPASTPAALVLVAGILVSIAVILLSSAALFALVARPPGGLALATLAGAGAVLWLPCFWLDCLVA